jgi:hypothetical protein
MTIEMDVSRNWDNSGLFNFALSIASFVSSYRYERINGGVSSLGSWRNNPSIYSSLMYHLQSL